MNQVISQQNLQLFDYKKYFSLPDEYFLKNNLFFFYGENTYFLHKAAEHLYKKSACTIKEKIFSFDTTIKEVSNKISTPLLFGDKPIIILYNFEQSKKKFRNDLLTLIKKIKIENKFLVIFEGFLSLSEKSDPLISFFLRNFLCVNFRNLSKQEIISSFIPKKLKKTISKQASELLYECCGNDLWLLANELEKLYYYSYNKDFITEDDVSNAISSYSSFDVNVFLQLLEKKDFNNIYIYLNKIFECGIQPVYICNILARNIRKSFASKQIDPSKIKYILETLQKLDLKIKTSVLSKQYLEKAIIDLYLLSSN